MPFTEGLGAVRSLGQQVRFIDTSAKTVIQPQFMTAGEFSSGLAPVNLRVPDGMRWGFINKEGNMAIAAKFYMALPFDEGLAPVRTSDGKWGYVGTDGNMAIGSKYDKALAFANGIAQVWIGEKFGYIDNTGKYVREPK
jgi:hypothetical protein